MTQCTALHTIEPEPGTWTPCTYVYASQTCRLCFSPIPRSKPAAIPDPKAPVRAYYNATLNDWECGGCRREAVRVERAIATAILERVLPELAPTGTGDLGAAAVTDSESGLTRLTETTEAA